ncbi:hypothetical protein J6590_060250 [Homalodisca vitripennis]|nr:hypothetical protein J6590_060250 [Homalodisca vitripennis]
MYRRLGTPVGIRSQSPVSLPPPRSSSPVTSFCFSPTVEQHISSEVSYLGIVHQLGLYVRPSKCQPPIAKELAQTCVVCAQHKLHVQGRSAPFVLEITVNQSFIQSLDYLLSEARPSKCQPPVAWELAQTCVVCAQHKLHVQGRSVPFVFGITVNQSFIQSLDYLLSEARPSKCQPPVAWELAQTCVVCAQHKLHVQGRSAPFVLEITVNQSFIQSLDYLLSEARPSKCQPPVAWELAQTMCSARTTQATQARPSKCQPPVAWELAQTCVVCAQHKLHVQGRSAPFVLEITVNQSFIQSLDYLLSEARPSKCQPPVAWELAQTMCSARTTQATRTRRGRANVNLQSHGNWLRQCVVRAQHKLHVQGRSVPFVFGITSHENWLIQCVVRAQHKLHVQGRSVPFVFGITVNQSFIQSLDYLLSEARPSKCQPPLHVQGRSVPFVFGITVNQSFIQSLDYLLSEARPSKCQPPLHVQGRSAPFVLGITVNQSFIQSLDYPLSESHENWLIQCYSSACCEAIGTQLRTVNFKSVSDLTCRLVRTHPTAIAAIFSHTNLGQIKLGNFLPRFHFIATIRQESGHYLSLAILEEEEKQYFSVYRQKRYLRNADCARLFQTCSLEAGRVGTLMPGISPALGVIFPEKLSLLILVKVTVGRYQKRNRKDDKVGERPDFQPRLLGLQKI